MKLLCEAKSGAIRGNVCYPVLIRDHEVGSRYMGRNLKTRLVQYKFMENIKVFFFEIFF